MRPTLSGRMPFVVMALLLSLGLLSPSLLLAEQMGLGTADLQRIEVVGTPIQEARYAFRRA